jgi:ribosomal protein S18 acetylase RimI-like enzyme
VALRFMLLDTRRHDRGSFCCGIEILDDYLQQRAGQHQRDGIATTHVLVDDVAPGSIVGYVSLAAAQLHLHDLQPSDRKRLPAYPIPAARVGRLAVSNNHQGKGYGILLLGHAVNSSRGLRAQVGVRVLVVDAKDERAASFYRAFGFQPTTTAELTMYLPLGND